MKAQVSPSSRNMKADHLLAGLLHRGGRPHLLKVLCQTETRRKSTLQRMMNQRNQGRSGRHPHPEIQSRPADGAESWKDYLSLHRPLTKLKKEADVDRREAEPNTVANTSLLM